MTDTPNDTVAPPKKRFGFKKAAWQTAPKTEAQDLFSHAHEFNDIVAEEARRKSEAKKKSNIAHERKVDEGPGNKRRKVSIDQEEKELHAELRSSPRGHRRAPLSPANHSTASDSLATRYDSLTKSSSSSVGAANKSEVVDLGSSDSEDEHDVSHFMSPSPLPIPIHSRPNNVRDSSEEVEEVDEPHIQALKAAARAKKAAAAKVGPGTSTLASVEAPRPQPPRPVAIVQLLIDSQIPGTKPLLVKVKSDTTLSRPKEAWCTRQGLDKSKVFTTWKRNRIYDHTLIQRLGMQIENGYVTMKDDPTIYDEENLPKIHVEAWTDDVWKEQKAIEAMEAAKAAVDIARAEEPEREPEPEAKQVRLILRAKGQDDVKIKVRGVSHTSLLIKKEYRADTIIRLPQLSNLPMHIKKAYRYPKPSPSH